LIIVIIMHVLLAYALVSGLAKKVVDVVKVVEAKAVDAPPPPPPPPPKDLPPPPKNLPPPPVYVPPPPVDVPPPPIAPTVQATNIPPPPAVEKHVEAATPAPPPPPAVQVAARAARVDANDPACRPEFPPAAARAGTTGVSKIKLTVDANGKVQSAEVVGSSGPTREHRLLDNAAKAAFSSCHVIPGIDSEGHPVGTTTVAEYVWKLE
jgi:protein TonB